MELVRMTYGKSLPLASLHGSSTYKAAFTNLKSPDALLAAAVSDVSRGPSTTMSDKPSKSALRGYGFSLTRLTGFANSFLGPK